MPDAWLRAVPTDSDVDDGRLYTQGADSPPVGGSIFLRTLLGLGLSLIFTLLT